MTLRLPDALAPWRRELSLFPLELAIELGGLVRRLASAIGPPVATRHRGDDPDGYDGIAHVGPYDRMLQSEWLLADEMPDEFLRRAVMREQLFFRIARRSPLDELLSVALFDAGPTQFGAPRILHLALLVVLSQRCAERGGTFRWAVLQEHPRRIHDRLDTDGVRALLGMRTVHEVDEATLDEWSDLLPHGDRLHRETWMIGGARLARMIERHGRDFRESSVVSIEEPLDIRERVLQTRIQRAGGRRQELKLPLPSDPATIRLLRDPFGANAPAVVKSSEVPTDFFFAAGGKQLIGRAAGHGVVLHRVGRGARPKLYEERNGNPVIAAGSGRQKSGASVAMDLRRQELILGSIHRQGYTIQLSPPADFPFGQQLHHDAKLRPLIRTSDKSMHPYDFLFLDARDSCWLTQRMSNTLVRIADGVAAITRHDGDPHLARMRGEWQIERIEGDSPRIVARYPGFGARAFFGTPAEDAQCTGLLIALEESPDRWSVISGETLHTNTCPPDARVIGVTAIGRSNHPSLVYVDKRSIFISHVTTIANILTTEAPIDVAVVDPSGPRVAYVSGDELVVYALDQRKVLHRAGSRT